MIGLIVSIGAITSAGFKAARATSTITSELDTAGAEMSRIAADLKAISLILHELKRRLSKADNLSVEVLDVAYEVTVLCKSDIKGVEHFITPLTSPSGKNLKFKDKVKGLFDKGKVSSRRASLDSLKLTLSLFLYTLDFIENQEDGGDDVADHIKEEICDLVDETQFTKTAFLHAARLNNIAELEEDTSSESFLQIEDGKAKPEDSASNDTIILRSSISNQEQIQPYRFQSQTHPAMLVDNMSDQDFIEVVEHLRLQKVARTLALKIVHPTQSQEVHSASFNDTAEGNIYDWQDTDAHCGTYTLPPSRAQLEEELANTKKHLNQCLERITLLDRAVATYEAEKSTREDK
ncbi:hypothetical protein FSPOR_6698 [Fusarium sporotrichioides]|uniref:Fungal N-terminal domain-containing protein n=1 Tax=Fusarium sporotrichioides TaxID=5514 RepID=A0A395S1N4_FUSSP|nr:hypothetical protein FSPOR_6698 [Fusarium sporotrichioides]